MKHYHIWIFETQQSFWKLEWNTLKLEYLIETQSYSEFWLKHYHIWIIEWNTIIFENLNETQAYLKIWMKHFNI